MSNSSRPVDEEAIVTSVSSNTPIDVDLSEPSDEALPPGAVVSDYVIEEMTNQGGFASVYRAHSARTGQRVALKVLWRELTGSSRLVKRFEYEAKTLLRLQHPNIVAVVDYGTLADGRPYFAMEWLGARNLRDVIRARGPLSPDEALAVMTEVSAALGAAHAAGIIHRDLKSQNIMVVPKGEGFTVKLVDFGIAKVLEPDKIGLAEFVTTSTILGTPFYMAPEQILGQPVDRRTDIYALGLLLYELVTGELPFRGETRVQIEEAHLRAPPPRASDVVPVSPAFDAVIARCLAKEQANRYATASEFIADLTRVLASPGAIPRPAPERLGVGLHVEVRIDPAVDEVPEDAFDDVDRVMDEARRACLDAKLVLDMEAASALLALGLLPDDEAGCRTERGRVLGVALELDRRLAARARPSPHVQVALTLHSAMVRVKPGAGKLEFSEGPLLGLGAWTAHHPDSGVAATTAMLEGLMAGLVTEPIAQHPELLRVRGA